MKSNLKCNCNQTAQKRKLNLNRCLLTVNNRLMMSEAILACGGSTSFDFCMRLCFRHIARRLTRCSACFSILPVSLFQHNIFKTCLCQARPDNYFMTLSYPSTNFETFLFYLLRLQNFFIITNFRTFNLFFLIYGGFDFLKHIF